MSHQLGGVMPRVILSKYNVLVFSLPEVPEQLPPVVLDPLPLAQTALDLVLLHAVLFRVLLPVPG